MASQNFSGIDTTLQSVPCGQESDEGYRIAKQLWDEFNSDAGLARLERQLGLPGVGSDPERIEFVATEVERRVVLWEKMTPTALIREHDVISSLFAIRDKAYFYATVNDNYIPDFWWARLVIAMDEGGFYDRLGEQVRRETRASFAQSILQDERSIGGKNSAAKSPAGKAKKEAERLWPEANRKGWTATKMYAELVRLGHVASPGRVAKWMTNLRKTGRC